jgi:ubiquitin C-terminal hydrolase
VYFGSVEDYHLFLRNFQLLYQNRDVSQMISHVSPLLHQLCTDVLSVSEEPQVIDHVLSYVLSFAAEFAVTCGLRVSYVDFADLLVDTCITVLESSPQIGARHAIRALGILCTLPEVREKRSSSVDVALEQSPKRLRTGAQSHTSISADAVALASLSRACDARGAPETATATCDVSDSDEFMDSPDMSNISDSELRDLHEDSERLESSVRTILQDPSGIELICEVEDNREAVRAAVFDSPSSVQRSRREIHTAADGTGRADDAQLGSTDEHFRVFPRGTLQHFVADVFARANSQQVIAKIMSQLASSLDQMDIWEACVRLVTSFCSVSFPTPAAHACGLFSHTFLTAMRSKEFDSVDLSAFSRVLFCARRLFKTHAPSLFEGLQLSSLRFILSALQKRSLERRCWAVAELPYAFCALSSSSSTYGNYLDGTDHVVRLLAAEVLQANIVELLLDPRAAHGEIVKRSWHVFSALAHAVSLTNDVVDQLLSYLVAYALQSPILYRDFLNCISDSFRVVVVHQRDVGLWLLRKIVSLPLSSLTVQLLHLIHSLATACAELNVQDQLFESTTQTPFMLPSSAPLVLLNASVFPVYLFVHVSLAGTGEIVDCAIQCLSDYVLAVWDGKKTNAQGPSASVTQRAQLALISRVFLDEPSAMHPIRDVAVRLLVALRRYDELSQRRVLCDDSLELPSLHLRLWYVEQLHRSGACFIDGVLEAFLPQCLLRFTLETVEFLNKHTELASRAFCTASVAVTLFLQLVTKLGWANISASLYSVFIPSFVGSLKEFDGLDNEGVLVRVDFDADGTRAECPALSCLWNCAIYANLDAARCDLLRLYALSTDAVLNHRRCLWFVEKLFSFLSDGLNVRNSAINLFDSFLKMYESRYSCCSGAVIPRHCFESQGLYTSADRFNLRINLIGNLKSADGSSRMEVPVAPYDTIATLKHHVAVALSAAGTAVPNGHFVRFIFAGRELKDDCASLGPDMHFSKSTTLNALIRSDDLQSLVYSTVQVGTSTLHEEIAQDDNLFNMLFSLSEAADLVSYLPTNPGRKGRSREILSSNCPITELVYALECIGSEAHIDQGVVVNHLHSLLFAGLSSLMARKAALLLMDHLTGLPENVLNLLASTVSTLAPDNDDQLSKTVIERGLLLLASNACVEASFWLLVICRLPACLSAPARVVLLQQPFCRLPWWMVGSRDLTSLLNSSVPLCGDGIEAWFDFGTHLVSQEDATLPVELEDQLASFVMTSTSTFHTSAKIGALRMLTSCPEIPETTAIAIAENLLIDSNCLFPRADVSLKDSIFPRASVDLRTASFAFLSRVTSSIPGVATVVDTAVRFCAASIRPSPPVTISPFGSSIAQFPQPRRGLRNLGCTCYMNATLQQLYSRPHVRKSVMELKSRQAVVDKQRNDHEISTDTGVSDKRSKIVVSVQKLFAQLYASADRFVDPSDFIRAVGADPSVQQDAEEFLSFLVDQLGDDFCASTMRGTVQNVLSSVDPTVPYESKRDEHFVALSVDVAGRVCLEDSLKAMFSHAEEIQGFKVGTQEVTVSKTMRLADTPDIMVLHLKRFSFDFESMVKKKIHDLFQFPYELDMAPYLADQSVTSGVHVYRLVGIVVHAGSADSGHYYSYVRDAASTLWYCLNDAVTEVWDENSMSDAAFGGDKRTFSAYMLFYSRIDLAAEKQCETSTSFLAPFWEDVIRKENICHSREFGLFDPLIEERLFRPLLQHALLPPEAICALARYFFLVICRNKDRVNMQVQAYAEFLKKCVSVGPNRLCSMLIDRVMGSCPFIEVVSEGNVDWSICLLNLFISCPVEVLRVSLKSLTAECINRDVRCASTLHSWVLIAVPALSSLKHASDSCELLSAVICASPSLYVELLPQLISTFVHFINGPGKKADDAKMVLSVEASRRLAAAIATVVSTIEDEDVRRKYIDELYHHRNRLAQLFSSTRPVIELLVQSDLAFDMTFLSLVTAPDEMADCLELFTVCVVAIPRDRTDESRYSVVWAATALVEVAPRTWNSSPMFDLLGSFSDSRAYRPYLLQDDFCDEFITSGLPGSESFVASVFRDDPLDLLRSVVKCTARLCEFLITKPRETPEGTGFEMIPRLSTEAFRYALPSQFRIASIIRLLLSVFDHVKDLSLLPWPQIMAAWVRVSSDAIIGHQDRAALLELFERALQVNTGFVVGYLLTDVANGWEKMFRFLITEISTCSPLVAYNNSTFPRYLRIVDGCFIYASLETQLPLTAFRFEPMEWAVGRFLCSRRPETLTLYAPIVTALVKTVGVCLTIAGRQTADCLLSHASVTPDVVAAFVASSPPVDLLSFVLSAVYQSSEKVRCSHFKCLLAPIEQILVRSWHDSRPLRVCCSFLENYMNSDCARDQCQLLESLSAQLADFYLHDSHNHDDRMACLSALRAVLVGSQAQSSTYRLVTTLLPMFYEKARSTVMSNLTGGLSPARNLQLQHRLSISADAGPQREDSIDASDAVSLWLSHTMPGFPDVDNSVRQILLTMVVRAFDMEEVSLQVNAVNIATFMVACGTLSLDEVSIPDKAAVNAQSDDDSELFTRFFLEKLGTGKIFAEWRLLHPSFTQAHEEFVVEQVDRFLRSRLEVLSRSSQHVVDDQLLEAVEGLMTWYVLDERSVTRCLKLSSALSHLLIAFGSAVGGGSSTVDVVRARACLEFLTRIDETPVASLSSTAGLEDPSA